MSLPSKVTLPPTTLRKPEMVRMVVVLPAPLAPTSVTISPSLTVKEIPFNASIFP